MVMKQTTKQSIHRKASRANAAKLEHQLVSGRKFLEKYREVFKALANRH
jgi:hypothetical protein